MIRAATEADLPGLAALDRELFGADAWSEDALRSELAGPGRVFLVADEGELVGYAVSMTVGEVADLQRIGVHPLRRRAGHAGALLTALVAASSGAQRMLLEVSAANDVALAFYRRYGFERINVRSRYYRDGTDAWVLSRDLDDDVSGRMDP